MKPKKSKGYRLIRIKTESKVEMDKDGGKGGGKTLCINTDRR